MQIRNLGLGILVVGMLILGVTVVGAQDVTVEPLASQGRQPRAIRTVVNIVTEETGLSPRDIMVQMRDGLSLADIISANGGDVDQVIATSVSQLTDAINQAVTDGKLTQERADRLLANLQDVVTRGINGELFPNRSDRGAVRGASERILAQAVADATGLRVPQVLQQVREGSTLADIITAYGGDVDMVVNNAVTAAAEQINAAVATGRLGQEQADQLIANLPDLYSAAANGQLHPNGLQQRLGRSVLVLAADQTGMTVQDIVQELRSGKSLSDILIEHNIGPSAFIDGAVANVQERLDMAVSNGRITQEQADQMLQTFRDRLTEHINQSGVANPEATPSL